MLSLTDLNGYEVAQHLRHIEQKNTPILADSSQASSRDKEHSIRVGCNAHISKPIDVDRIAEQVAAYM